ncbi:MAG TPA: hypothetical protein VKH37_02220, partial [Ferruginibacter sp.]|nr:hypothetical protein [Ferruginibacter sp.]
MKRILFVSIMLIAFSVQAQDYKIGMRFKSGYANMFITKTTPATNMFYNSTSVTRYGLLNKNNEMVLPIKYERVNDSYADGVFIV